jgi:hypothetical protein
MSSNLPFFAPACAGAAPAFGSLRRLLGHGTAFAAAFAPAEHLHLVGADLRGVAILAVLVLPLARAQAAFDVDLRAFLQVLAGDFGKAAEERDAVPLGGFLLLAARLVFPRFRGRDADVRHRIAARQVFGFRVSAEIANDDHLVHRSHVTPLVSAIVSRSTCRRKAR